MGTPQACGAGPAPVGLTGALVSVLRSSHFRGHHAIVLWRPGRHLAVYSKAPDRRREAGRSRWGAGVTAEPFGTSPGPILGVEKAPQCAPGRQLRGRTHLPGKPIVALAPQLRPSLGHTRAFRDHLGQLPPVTKGSAAA